MPSFVLLNQNTTSHRSPHPLHKQFLPFLQGLLQGEDVTSPSPGHCHVSRMALENTLFQSDEGKNFTSQKVTISCPTHQNQWKVDVSSVLYMCREGAQGKLHLPPHSHALIHTWCTTKLTLAINMGYIILEIYEVLHWSSNEEIDGSTGRGGLFTEDINMFLCIKAQASGYPNNVCTLKQR